MVPKRLVILGVLALCVGAALSGTIWHLRGNDLQGALTAGASQIIDDGDAGFVASGRGWQTYQHALGYGGDILSPTSVTDTSLAATWKFSNLSAGQYKFFVTFKAYSLLTNQAPYVIKDGASVVGSAAVNQKVDPSGNTYNQKNWYLLGTYTIKGPTVSITLLRPQNLAANGVIVDAARIERVGGSVASVAAAPAMMMTSSAKSVAALPTKGVALPALPTQGAASSAGMPLAQQSSAVGGEAGGAAAAAPMAGYPNSNCPRGLLNCSCPINMNWRECGEWACPNANKEFDEQMNACVCPEGWGCADGSNSMYCTCERLSCPDGYWLNPETYTCIPNTVCGDGYLDRIGSPKELCELNGNQGCPEGEFCLNCTSCLQCGDTLLTNNEECEADFTCPLGTSCNASCQCSDFGTSQFKNTTTLDTSSNLMTRTTISNDITRTSWTVPVRTGETYDIFVRTQRYQLTINKNTQFGCPINFWKVFNGSTRVLPLSADSKMQYGDALCYPDSYASASPTWILLTQIRASATSIRVEHEPTPLPANASATDPARRLAVADAIRIEKVAGASSSSLSSAWTACPSGYSCPVLWVNNQCARRSITCGIGKVLQCDSTCGNADCSGPCCKCVQGSSSSRSSSSSSSSSSLACVQEGQSAAVLPGAATCCPGLNGVSYIGPGQNGSCPDALPGGAYRCVQCGNGLCGLGENYCNCPADCPQPRSSSSSSSSSKSSSKVSSSTTSSAGTSGAAWIQVGPPHTAWNSCTTECAARGKACAETGCTPFNSWNGISHSGGEKLVANGSPYSYTCSNAWGNIFENYLNYCCCTGGASVSSASSASSASSLSTTCTDSDGADYFTAGTVQVENTTYEDSCDDCGSGNLPCLSVREMLCNSSQVTSEKKLCTDLRSGFICESGRCVDACGDGLRNFEEQCDGAPSSACESGQICTSGCRCATPPPGSLSWQTVGNSYLVSTLSDYALFGYASSLYLVGGKDFWGPTNSELRSTDGLTWASVASLPEPLSNAAAVQTEGKALLLGGLKGSDTATTSAFETNDLTTSGFQSNPSLTLPVARYNGSVLRVGTRTFFLSGSSKSSSLASSLLGSLLASLFGDATVDSPSLEIYVHNGTSWTQLPDLPFDVTENGAFSLGNKLFILDNSSPRKVFESADGTAWTQVSTLPAPTTNTTLMKPVLHKGAIWFIGTTGSFAGSAVVTTDGQQWTTVPGTFPSDLSGFSAESAVSFKNDLWMLGTVNDLYTGGNNRTGKVLKSGVSIGQICGNGTFENTEQCDDNNTVNDDGCSSTCQIESGWICDGQPSICDQWTDCDTGYSCDAVPFFGNDTAWHCGRTGGLEAGCVEEHNGASCGNDSWCAASCHRFVCNSSASSSVGTTMIWNWSDTIPVNTKPLKSVTYGNGKFVAVGTSGKGAYSLDGITWTAITDTKVGTNSLTAITYGNGKFVAVGEKGKGAYSLDGITWTAITDTKVGTSTLAAIAYGNGRFVAVGNAGVGTSSADGITWTAITDTKFFGEHIYAVAYGNGKFVAVGPNGKASFSADGITWTKISDMKVGVAFLYGVTYGNGKFVAVGEKGKGAYSLDGITWTAISDLKISASDLLRSVTAGNGRFVAVGNYGIGTYSIDGMTWTRSAVGNSQQLFSETFLSVIFASQRFVTVGDHGKGAYAWFPGTGSSTSSSSSSSSSSSFSSSSTGPTHRDCFGPDGTIFSVPFNQACPVFSSSSSSLACAEEGQRVYSSSVFGPTVCCSKNSGIKPSSILADGMCIATNDGSIGTCIENWWFFCGNGTCNTGEDRCNCQQDCPVVCPAFSPPFCTNGVLVPQMSADANGCSRPPVCCEGANNPQAQCSMDLQCGNGTCLISSCTCN